MSQCGEIESLLAADERTAGAQNPRTAVALQRLVALYEGPGNTTAAAGYRAKIPH